MKKSIILAALLLFTVFSLPLHAYQPKVEDAKLNKKGTVTYVEGDYRQYFIDFYDAVIACNNR